MSNITRQQLYQRQTSLAELGDSGQLKLKNTSVAVIGCGGLGSVAAVYLAASGIGNIHLVDFDVVDVSNLHRQVYYGIEDVGKSKVEVLTKYIQSIAPFTKLTSTDQAVSKNNIVDILNTVEYVLDCTDQLPIKYLINDACVLKNKTLVYGSLYKFDGYVATFNAQDSDGNRTANLRDAFPEIPTENIPNCAELGTLNTIVGIIGLMQANEVLKLVTGIGKPLLNELLIYNSADCGQFKMKLKNKVDKKDIAEIFERETYENAICEIDAELEISQADFQKIVDEEHRVWNIISVIENTNQELPFEVDEKAPLSEFDDWISTQFNSEKNYIFVCNKGITSMIAATRLTEKFQEANVLSLAGGISEFIQS